MARSAFEDKRAAEIGMMPVKRLGRMVLACLLALSAVPASPAFADAPEPADESALVGDVLPADEADINGDDSFEPEVPSDQAEGLVVEEETASSEGAEAAEGDLEVDDSQIEEGESASQAASMLDAVPLALEAETVEDDLPQSWRITDGVPNNYLLELAESSGAVPFGAYSDVPDDYRSTWSKSDGVGTYSYRVNSNDAFQKIKVPGAKEVGIDVSYYNNQTSTGYQAIDWAKVRADGITFAIIRIGDGGSNGKFFVDPWFVRNIQGARAAGIKVGAYVYSRARHLTGDTYSVSNEVSNTLAQLKAAGMKPSDLALPVYLDMEDSTQRGLGKDAIGEIATSYCNAIKSAGYKVGIYANQDWYNNVLTADVFKPEVMKRNDWSRWVARYSWGSSSSGVTDTDIWQFTSIGKVNGQHRSYCDVNFSFQSFNSTTEQVVLTGTPNTWKWMNGYAYYYGSDGKAVRWSQKIDGKWYYFDGQYRMQTGWVTWSADGTKSYFEPGSDGLAPALTGWREIDGEWYYFNPANGISLRWSQWINGNLFYFNGESQMKTGWVTWVADGTKSYFDPSSGRAWKGWQTIGGKRYYFDAATCKSKRWSQKIDGSWYYFDGDSVMFTGLLTWSSDGLKSYYGPDGKARSGWQTVSGKTYYIDVASGKTLRWSQKIGGQWYYFNGESVMQTGWITWKNGTKSYFHPDASGHAAALLGWRSFNGVKYYFDEATGISRIWSQKIDGQWYYFNGSGVMQTGWITWKDGTKSYFHPDASGHAAALLGWRSWNGVKYYFDPATGISKRWSQWIDGGYYYFNSASQMVKGWVTWSADGTRSYFGSDGKALFEWQIIGGKTYYFDATTAKSFVGMHTIDGQPYCFDSSGALIGISSQTKNESTGVSLTAMASKEYANSPSSLGYSLAQITSSMTPASTKSGTNGFYQFAQLNSGYSGLVSAAQLDAYIASTANGRSGTLANMGQAFVDASRRSGVNEAYLLGHAILESGWGTSTLAKGYYYDGKTLVAGKLWPAGTYYNFYGIGAYDSSPLSGGRALAIKNGWNTPQKAIEGAAQWISTNYLNNGYGQNTLYKMRWNYAEFKGYGSVGHQYATDREWATKIAAQMAAIYAKAGVTQQNAGLTFLVPVYQ